MAERHTHDALDHGDAIATPTIRQRRSLSPIWLVPLVAAGIGGWLAYRAVVDQGPLIAITFETAEGIEAGKTKVRFKDVEVGSVEAVRIGDELEHVVVSARIAKSFERHVTDRSSFWIVRPRIGAGGVSGLGTLLSGAYVEIDTQPGGTPQHSFTGVDEPPLITSTVPGTRFVLKADDLGSVSRGAPVNFDGIQVGEVLGHELDPAGGGVTIHVFVRAPHHELVRETTRFWNSGGIRLSVGANGQPEIVIPPLQALLIGGVEFDTPLGVDRGPAAADGTTFPLFASRAASQQRHAMFEQPFVVNFEGSVRGLRPGAAVEFRGIRIGTVRSVQLAYDAATERLRIPVVIAIESQNQVQRPGSSPTPETMIAAIDDWVRRGLRARLETGSLLTGDLIITLDFYPGQPNAELLRTGDLPEIPTIPSQIEEVTASVTGLLKRFAALPIEDIAQDVRKTVQAFAAIATSPEVKSALTGLDASMATFQTSLTRLDKVAGSVERDVPAVLDAARGTATAATQTLQQARVAIEQVNGMVGPSSALRYDLTEAIKQLAAAARSIRAFADYLERQPDALLRGRQGGR